MANLRANFMFNRDFEDAFLHVIKSLLSVNVQDVKVQNAVKFFIYPSVALSENLRKYGCWCDKALNSPHHYKDCHNIKGLPYPSIIGKDPHDHGKRKLSHLPLCPDLDENVPEHSKDHNHRLGCFKPVEAAEKFMDWFMVHGVKAYSDSWDEKQAVRTFVNDYMRRVSIYETGEIDRIDKEDMVLSLLLGFQGSDIEDSARKSPVAWEAERLLKFLGWNKLDFKTNLKEDDPEETGKSRGAVQQENNTEEKNRPGSGPEGNIRRGGAFLQKNNIIRENRRGGPILQKHNTTGMRVSGRILQESGRILQESGRILQERGRGGTLQGNDMKEKIERPVLQERDLEEKEGGGDTTFQQNNLQGGWPILQEEDIKASRPVIQEENLRGE
ncbi:hypothetical protein GGI42DRAFT_366769 [Trichoderma sp. SZMC 28013]